MWDGYFALGGNEIGNSPRTLAYARTAECAPEWLVGFDDCPNLWQVLDDDPYDTGDVTDAPWYDPDNPDKSSRFLGLYIVDLIGLQDDTREAAVTQKNSKGAKVGSIRYASREVRCRAVLTAVGLDALEYGRVWLASALSTDACGTHGSACGGADLEFFADVPPTDLIGIPDPLGVDAVRRYLHSVKCVSGPLVQEEWLSRTSGHNGLLVEFTFVAEMPDIYSLTREIAVPPTLPSVVEDTAYNLIPYPSAEIAAGSVVIARNLSTNPSAETDATGYVATHTTVSGSSETPYWQTPGRSTDIAVSPGVASMRARILGNGSTAASGVTNVEIYQDVSLAGLATGTRPSFSVWASVIEFAGSAVSSVGSIVAVAQWRTSGGAVLSETTIGTATTLAEFAGKVFSIKNVAIPSTAATVRVVVRFNTVAWASSATAGNNTDIRLYVDDIAVTVP